MTCSECLRLVAVADVADLDAEPAIVAHCQGCAGCARVVLDVASTTRYLADSLDNVPVPVPPDLVARRAIAGAALVRRDEIVGRWLWGGALAALALTVAALGSPTRMLGLFGVRHQPTVETIALRCLTPQQASGLVRPYLRAEGSKVLATPEGIPAVALRGTADEVQAARRIVRQFDDPRALPATAVCLPPTSPDVASAGARAPAADREPAQTAAVTDGPR